MAYQFVLIYSVHRRSYYVYGHAERPNIRRDRVQRRRVIFLPEREELYCLPPPASFYGV